MLIKDPLKKREWILSDEQKLKARFFGIFISVTFIKFSYALHTVHILKIYIFAISPNLPNLNL